jgi:DNA-binding NtrC family response regulator
MAAGTNTILVVDDEKSILDIMKMTLEYEGYQVKVCVNGPDALSYIKKSTPDAVLLDVKMPGMDGLEVLDHIRETDPSIPVIVLTGHGSIETAVEATKKGAFDFLSKPPDRDKILITLRNALQQNALLRENIEMRQEIEATEHIVGNSKPIKELLATVQRVAPTEAYILITGENGSGKELIAKEVHKHSKRVDKALVEVNCAAIPKELIESELFGHEKGAFTGATVQRIGKFESANEGTLLLDEIGDMSLEAQAKVLRVLEEGSFERVGGSKLISVDVRVIAATNKNLQVEIKEGKFREDLFHRLNVIPLNVPPLRERREDIPLLIDYFLEQVCAKNKLPLRVIENAAVKRLSQMAWPGNIRELRNAVERLAILVPDSISDTDVDRYVRGSSDEIASIFSREILFQEFKDVSERMFLKKQLERYDWNISKTAEMIDVQRSHLYTKLKKYGLTREDDSVG